MAQAWRPDGIVNLKGCVLLAVPLLVVGLCVFLNLTYTGLPGPAIALLAIASSFLAAMAAMAGLRIVRML